MINTEHPTFSIVIPNYKRIDTLVRAIKSVLKQELSDVLIDKIIIVDDKSENVNEIDDALIAFDDKRIVHIKNEFKTNAAYTRNQGARFSDSEWICFLDSDDCFSPSKLKYIADEIKRDLNDPLRVYVNKAAVFFDEKIEDIVPHRSIHEDEHISDYLFVFGEYLQTSTLTIHRSFFNDYGFNDRYIRHQDYDLCLTLYDLGYKFNILDFIGTNIYWGSLERPTNKGESVKYSYQWIEENKRRITSLGYNNFVFKFVAIKSIRLGMKAEALHYTKLVDLKKISFKQKVYFFLLMLMPVFAYPYLYKAFKRRKVNAFRRKNESIKRTDL
ncbi:UDP-Glc:alpha-D-GlcNAc-diphosphoundecaprenol beta-1,3-glucosyltransferase WfgD [Klebsiella spallanzanii]|uniref:UDP-Glc:alpha-D-GlcNAc-diphosphoundecaprenol beta-1,3-glucosyltransferase WfgD n=1 Tax=Klebsiella spallanzanii TaxID=2587528 RepID=A0ABY6VDV5_9ENTR|nr:glycosyltransferase family 2 protein [Klebsiella spallanzanii]VUS60286.1 UDP-Glc:alpha-D-GlcNAc-diphosphoundecaprenol beta-1,3-glucosyltransferase WfgD [Klebsiella spallanzanii]